MTGVHTQINETHRVQPSCDQLLRMRGRSAFLITLSRGKITQWVADEWSIGRYAGVSENDLMKIRTRTVMKKWTS